MYRHACNKEKISKIKPEKSSLSEIDGTNLNLISFDNDFYRITPQTAQIPAVQIPDSVPNLSLNVTSETSRKKEELNKIIEGAKKLVEQIENEQQSQFADDLSLEYLQTVRRRLRGATKRKASEMDSVVTNVDTKPSNINVTHSKPAILCGGKFLDGFDLFEDNNIWFKRDFMFNI
jgi:hypothetical protein